MADNRRYIPNQQLDLEQIQQAAKNRWLRPAEICEILGNYQQFCLTPDPPVRPPAGSLFLFDRKALRYFRKDGHRWRKKKDGKTVREAHEKLKAGSVDVLHCYYAHGEDNENFQRRSYWMLDGQLEHIVLVHYREVKEVISHTPFWQGMAVAGEQGYKPVLSPLPNTDPATTDIRSPQAHSAPFVAKSNSAVRIAQTSHASSANTTHWMGQTFSSDFDEGDSSDVPKSNSLSHSIYDISPHNSSLHVHKAAGHSRSQMNSINSEFAQTNFNHGTISSPWTQIQTSNRDVHRAFDQQCYFEQPVGSGSIFHKLLDTQLDANRTIQDPVTFANRMSIDENIQTVSAASHEVFEVLKEHDFQLVYPQFQNFPNSHGTITSSQVKNEPEDGKYRNESVELKKLDSFGRWLDKEIGVDCDDSLMASDSGNYWNTLDAQNDDKEVSSLSRQMQLDVGSLGPSLSKEQLFSIDDFSPDWAYSGVKTKVLITGTFLGNIKHSIGTKWCCMFGEIEVPAEVLSNNTIRCQAPSHAPGRVPFYITYSNRLACSEVREFEYRQDISQDAFSLGVRIVPEDELLFQIRLAKMLHVDLESKGLDCSSEECDNCKLKESIDAIKSGQEADWKKIEAASTEVEGNKIRPKDALIENFLKFRLCEWLICKVREGGKGPNIWDEAGYGIIHLTAALGYDWAFNAIVYSGVSPNFRDAHGKTGLHWAAFFGREQAISALVSLGANPGAVDDPNAAFPGGQTASDLASIRGHKGIAGYLAEAHLISHLSSLTIQHNLIDNVDSVDTVSDMLATSDSMRGSLDAVLKSTHAAALIQASFRARSFCQRQLTVSENDISKLVALGSLNKIQKMSHFGDYLHSAAVKIQKKYRGWKGRRDFVKIRNRIVKIQAHVRGHQVRKQYKKVVWSVGIVEKAILRWRRKGSGLRGFRVEKVIGSLALATEKTDEYEFLRIGRKQKFDGIEKALARVKSMARHPEARDQYMRLITKFGTLEARGSQQIENANENLTVEDRHAFAVE